MKPSFKNKIAKIRKLWWQFLVLTHPPASLFPLLLLRQFFNLYQSHLNLSRRRLHKVISAMASEQREFGSASACSEVFKLTYLEANSWLWELAGVNILVDPILVGNLDFGIPWLYASERKYLKDFQLSDLPQLDCLLITQGLDDHCHLKTLTPLSELYPDLKVIATPNAKSLLEPLFKNVTYVKPGERSEIEGRNGCKIIVKAAAAVPLIPWKQPENGYLVSAPQGGLTLYYEPHCTYDKDFLKDERADIVIAPPIKLLFFKVALLPGQEDAVKLAKLLRAKYIVPMNVADADIKGLLGSRVRAVGTMESFKELMAKELPEVQVLEPTPGVPLQISKS